MTREEAKRRLLDIERCTPIHTREDVRDFEALEMAIQALKQEPKWIPVSERLPEDDRPVLIYAWNVHYVIARYGEFRTDNGYKKVWVTADAWNGNTDIKHDVIAWMPLPEPYKAESEE